MFFALAVSGRRFRAHTVRPARCTSTSKSGIEPGFSRSSGRRVWPSTTACTASRGSGRPRTGPWARRHWQPNAQVGTQPTGGKKGRKRSLLVDGRGLPLSIAVSGANVHDSKLLDRTLAQIVVKRPEATWRNQQYLCLDAGYVGYPVRKIARKHGYYLRVKSRAEERLLKYRYPDSKPRRWVVERTHSWFNRFRKLLVSFEKTEASYLALLQLAAALICWRQTITICG
ncbi:MAG: IS5 family transposase [Bryobacteraceae bacterium]